MRLRKRAELKPVACPLCGKVIVGRDAYKLGRGFVRHIQRCRQYRALTACAAVLRGIRVPRYGHTVLDSMEITLPPGNYVVDPTKIPEGVRIVGVSGEEVNDGTT